MISRSATLIICLFLQGAAAFVTPRHSAVVSPTLIRPTASFAWKEDFAPGERDGSESGRRLNSAKLQKMRELEVWAKDDLYSLYLCLVL
jgi:hypothetical protein